MSKVDVELVGADRLARTLTRAADQLGDLSEPGARAAGIVARNARSRAPYDTGALAGSIDFEVDADEAVIYAGVRYARFVEYGPPRAQPFLGPALAEAEPDVERVYGDEVGAIVARVEGA